VDNQPVEYKDLVKGYEYEKGQFVELTDEDMAKVQVKATDQIIIDDFVDPNEIDAKFFEKPYYLLPGKKSDAAYALLRQALRQSGKVGIARVVIRSRERLAAVRVDGPMLMLDTMHFADEIRDADKVVPDTAVGKRELDMAVMLINAMSSKFDASKYKDTYRQAVLEMIDQKVAGKKVVHQEAKAQPTEILDLMAYLKRSIDERRKSTEDTKPKQTGATAKQPDNVSEAPSEKPARSTRTASRGAQNKRRGQ
jgi:DNA end-binding protein Ku